MVVQGGGTGTSASFSGANSPANTVGDAGGAGGQSGQAFGGAIAFAPSSANNTLLSIAKQHDLGQQAWRAGGGGSQSGQGLGTVIDVGSGPTPSSRHQHHVQRQHRRWRGWRRIGQRSGSGGAITFEPSGAGATLTIDSSRFSGNTAGGSGGSNVSSGSGFGAAIACPERGNGVLTVTRSSFDSNSAGGQGVAALRAARESPARLHSIPSGTAMRCRSTKARSRAIRRGARAVAALQAALVEAARFPPSWAVTGFRLQSDGPP